MDRPLTGPAPPGRVTIREVGPTATIIETEEHGLLNRHTVPNTKMLNEAVR